MFPEAGVGLRVSCDRRGKVSMEVLKDATTPEQTDLLLLLAATLRSGVRSILDRAARVVEG